MEFVTLKWEFNEAQTFTFETKPELDAFMRGVNVVVGATYEAEPSVVKDSRAGDTLTKEKL